MRHNAPDCSQQRPYHSEKCALKYLQVNDLVSGMHFKMPQKEACGQAEGGAEGTKWSRLWSILLKPGEGYAGFMPCTPLYV